MFVRVQVPPRVHTRTFNRKRLKVFFGRISNQIDSQLRYWFHTTSLLLNKPPPSNYLGYL